ncbi:hypothetical protein KDA14_05120 [Candidatus Saccharibacteria bacterium]|nr:hypothetical protein [Candidatus Saccharibacteria bacterium]
MKQNKLQRPLLLAGTLIVDIFLLWFGFKLLTTQTDIGSTGLFMVGLAACFGGLFILTPPTKIRLIGGGIVFSVGVYYLLRAFGVIESRILVTTLGLASLFAAVVLTYIVMGKPETSPDNSDKSEPAA